MGSQIWVIRTDRSSVRTTDYSSPSSCLHTATSQDPSRYRPPSFHHTLTPTPFPDIHSSPPRFRVVPVSVSVSVSVSDFSSVETRSLLPSTPWGPGSLYGLVLYLYVSVMDSSPSWTPVLHGSTYPSSTVSRDLDSL